LDARCFDVLIRDLARHASRRSALAGLIGAGVAALAGTAGRGDALGKKRRKRKKNRCAGNQQRCDGSCKDLLTDEANCGVCGNACAALESCVQGDCACNGGQGQCLSGCACADRLGGGKVCFKGGNDGTTCDSDSDCPFRSLCFSINKCSIPCVA
jgi:hypothetical protein